MNPGRWTPETAPLVVREQSQVAAAPELVALVEPDHWADVRLSATRAAGEKDWTVAAAQYVGVARLRVGASEIALVVEPKLPVDVFFLADYAFGGGSDRNVLVDKRLKADLDAIRDEPAACLLAWFFADIESFARRHLRRTYVLRREVLEGELRERLLLDDYVTSHVAEGLPQEVPCEFPDLSMDTLPNRVIRATVRHATRQIPLIQLEMARRALRRQARRTLSLFVGVSNERLDAHRFHDLRRIGAPRHYWPVIDRCEAMYSGMHLEREVGGTVRQAFMWNMNTLFEQALRGVLELWPSAKLVRARPHTVIESPSGQKLSSARVNPDYVLSGSWGTLVLDAKYKDTGLSDDAQEIEVPGAGKVRVAPSDLYQAVAYREHNAYPAAACGLVYPVALAPEQPLPQPRTVTGFGDPIHLLFLDVGIRAQASLPSFYAALEGVVSTGVDLELVAA